MTSLRAINTPFLVTSDDLVAEIISSDVADELMAGLDAAGVVGLALVPESLRHPFGFDHPLFGPDDYAGVVMPRGVGEHHGDVRRVGSDGER